VEALGDMCKEECYESHAMRNEVVEELTAERVGETLSRHMLDSVGSTHGSNS